MKKYKKIIVSLIIVMIIIGFKGMEAKTNKTIIIEDSSINWASGFDYSGIVICDDGSIYKFSLTDKEVEYQNNYKNLEDLNKCILKNATKCLRKISKKDLEKIKEYSKNISSSNYSEKLNVMFDAG